MIKRNELMNGDCVDATMNSSSISHGGSSRRRRRSSTNSVASNTSSSSRRNSSGKSLQRDMMLLDITVTSYNPSSSGHLMMDGSDKSSSSRTLSSSKKRVHFNKRLAIRKYEVDYNPKESWYSSEDIMEMMMNSPSGRKHLEKHNLLVSSPQQGSTSAAPAAESAVAPPSPYSRRRRISFSGKVKRSSTTTDNRDQTESQGSTASAEGQSAVAPTSPTASRGRRRISFSGKVKRSTTTSDRDQTTESPPPSHDSPTSNKECLLALVDHEKCVVTICPIQQRKPWQGALDDQRCAFFLDGNDNTSSYCCPVCQKSFEGFASPKIDPDLPIKIESILQNQSQQQPLAMNDKNKNEPPAARRRRRSSITKTLWKKMVKA